MNEHELQLLSVEAFLRRANQIDLPFMVKGSILTRQLMPNPEMRFVADLDWVYLKSVDEYVNVQKVFSDWVTEITEMKDFDNVKFRSFKENDFWRGIDYAMHDDFPTVNTDLSCFVKGKENNCLNVDISFNLDIDYPPEKMLYIPREGKPFILKYTCPFPLQVSWKLHQLITRPRMKDVFDLIFLLQHERFTEDVFHKTIAALKKECDRDGIEISRLNWYINGNMTEYCVFEEMEIKHRRFDYLEDIRPDFYDFDLLGLHFQHFTSKEFFPYEKLSDIFEQLRQILNKKGFLRPFISSI